VAVTNPKHNGGALHDVAHASDAARRLRCGTSGSAVQIHDAGGSARVGNSTSTDCGTVPAWPGRVSIGLIMSGTTACTTANRSRPETVSVACSDCKPPYCQQLPKDSVVCCLVELAKIQAGTYSQQSQLCLWIVRGTRATPSASVTQALPSRAPSLWMRSAGSTTKACNRRALQKLHTKCAAQAAGNAQRRQHNQSMQQKRSLAKNCNHAKAEHVQTARFACHRLVNQRLRKEQLKNCILYKCPCIPPGDLSPLRSQQ
jgi:hypothetical protein